MTSRRIIDLSHPIEDGMVTYPGLPAPEITEHLTREASRGRYPPGTEFSIGRITMVANTGTYLDSPFHRFADGADLAGLPLERMVDLPGTVVHVAEGAQAIGAPDLSADEVHGRAVLFHTGWDRHWRTEAYGSGNPFLTRETAAWLAALERLPSARHVARAHLRPKRTTADGAAGDGSRPAHTRVVDVERVDTHQRGAFRDPGRKLV